MQSFKNSAEMRVLKMNRDISLSLSSASPAALQAAVKCRHFLLPSSFGSFVSYERFFSPTEPH